MIESVRPKSLNSPQTSVLYWYILKKNMSMYQAPESYWHWEDSSIRGRMSAPPPGWNPKTGRMLVAACVCKCKYNVSHSIFTPRKQDFVLHEKQQQIHHGPICDFSIRLMGTVPGQCGSKLQSQPTGSPWAPLLEVSYLVARDRWLSDGRTAACDLSNLMFSI